MSQLLVLNTEDVRRALPMDVAIDAMKRAYACLTEGHAVMPARTHLPINAHDGVSLVMPVYVNTDDVEALSVKVVSLFPGNIPRGIPLIQAAVMVFNAQTGQPTAILEGSTLTGIRTGAAAGAATDLLARPESCTAAIIGAGVQARTQLEAVCTARTIETAWIFGPTRSKAEAIVESMAGRGRIPKDLRVAKSPAEAITNADVICTATTSSTPVFDDTNVKAGAHINAVGSYKPHVREIPPDTVVRSRVFVDEYGAAREEAGDLIQPIEAGLIDWDHIQAELGEVVLGRRPGRCSDVEITFFKSVGVAVQDAFAADVAVRNALASGLGQSVDW